MNRFYRKTMAADGLNYYRVVVKETDLYIASAVDKSKQAYEFIKKERAVLENYIKTNSDFLHALIPLPIDEKAPLIAKHMYKAANSANVGPMAAVAGAFCQRLCEEIYKNDNNVIIENGGDIYIKTDRERTVSIYAGKNTLSGKLKIKITPAMSPIAVCTSSAKFGHSLSLGKADAACILSHDAYLADAAATSVCNQVKKPEDIPNVLEYAKDIKDVIGAVIICGGKIGAWGEIEFV